MENDYSFYDQTWLWGGVWVLYSFFYGRYFAHMAGRLKPDLKYVREQGSPERLRHKSILCDRFALFMLIPTTLEAMRATYFTSALISIAPCFFGMWVIRSVWTEVFCSKMPKHARITKAEKRAVRARKSGRRVESSHRS